MSVIQKPDYIRCRFDTGGKICARLPEGDLDIFFAETADLHSIYPELIKYLSPEETLRADKMLSKQIKKTFEVSHAVLRLCIASHLKTNPREIAFRNSSNAKPEIEDDNFYFNLSHTSGAFAFAMSSDYYVGIDIEEVNRKLNVKSIAKSFYSKAEQDYVMSSPIEKEERFVLIWTRKESFLKAIGTGMINDLHDVEVSGHDNIISSKGFDKELMSTVFNEHYIHTSRLNKYYLSVTVPCKPSIHIHHLRVEDIAFL